MAVTVHDVRVALNEITREELADSTIQQKIDEAEEDADNMGVETNERFIRNWAAYKAFCVSRSYLATKIGDVSVRRDLEMFKESLWKEAQRALEEVAGESLAVVSTPMFDQRPEDPYETS